MAYIQERAALLKACKESSNPYLYIVFCFLVVMHLSDALPREKEEFCDFPKDSELLIEVG
jgi:hypothetical protein